MQFGGGFVLMITLLVGAFVGVRNGQGSLGMVIGLVVGLVAVVLLAWRDNRRKR